jgi:uncharacterized protein (TIGR03067 family)
MPVQPIAAGRGHGGMVLAAVQRQARHGLCGEVLVDLRGSKYFRALFCREGIAMTSFVFLLMIAGLPVPADVSQRESAKTDKDYLQGTWTVESFRGFVDKSVQEDFQHLRLTVRGDEISARYGDKTARATYKLNPAGKPSKIDVTLLEGPEQVRGKIFHGIYLLEGDALRIAYRDPGKPRPEDFVIRDEGDIHQVFFKRLKP